MKMNLGKLLGVVQILAAIWYFNGHDWTRIIVSVLLVLNGTLSFLTDKQSRFLARTKKIIQILAVTIVGVLFIKLFFAG